MASSRYRGELATVAFLYGVARPAGSLPVPCTRHRMPWRGLEPRRLAAPPPQDGVSTNFTTRARTPAPATSYLLSENKNYVPLICPKSRSPLAVPTGATGLEPATSRVTVECSNQAELRPPMYCRSNGGTDARCRSFHRSTVPPFHRYCPSTVHVARRGVEPLSAP